MFHDAQGKDGKGVHCLCKHAVDYIIFRDKEVNKEPLCISAS